MEEFGRTFRSSVLAEHVRANPAAVVARLFRYWALPGERGATNSLRVAIRNGYVNLYVGGQSVARIAASQRRLSLTLHRKYHSGLEAGTEEARRCDQARVTLSDADLRSPETALSVERWITTARGYCGAEKLFVDDLIASNPEVVDLEMALPASEALRNKKGGKFVPRMDVVTLVTQSGPPCLNFWEAKCAANSELRANEEIDFSAETGARVAGQLRKYERALEGREQQVCKAFQNAGQVLCDLAETFGKDPTSPAVQAWSRLREQEPRLVRRPGIVVGNYTPGVRPGENDRHAQRVPSFARHRERLAAHFTVVEVLGCDDPNAVLPPLLPGNAA